MQNRAGDIGNIAAFPGELPMPQHLYFTSDEPIQDGNWLFERGEWGIKSVCQSMANWTKEDHLKYPNDKKIIASTDSSLGLPAIPFTWIRDVYVSSNGSIKEVRLETYRHVENVEVVNGVAPVYSDRLKLTPDNEVVIVNEPIIIGWSEEDKLKAYNDGKSSNKETYDWVNYKLPEKHGGPYTYSDIKNAYRKGFYEHQELEDAALSYFMLHPLPNMQHKIENAFKAGANWQKEQSATDGIEMLQWLCENCWTGAPPMWTNGEASSDCDGGKSTYTELTPKQLYELWQQLRKKSSSNSEHRSGR
jgi:hypothetical protein